MAESSLYIGIMSGTSLDGADAVLCRCQPGRTQFVAHAHLDYPANLRKALSALLTPGPDELERAGTLSIKLAGFYALVTRELLQKAAVSRRDIRAIGVHGQTVRHCPQNGFTVQLNNPALLAEITGIDVIADFRSRDMAAGGEGAPLVPAFHAAMFASTVPRAIVNIGGIANISLLNGDRVCGFDCGPGNTLMDCWVQQHCGLLYDEDALFAKKGRVNEKLLSALLSDPYFSRQPPKSTGREYFNLKWLSQRAPFFETLTPPDVQRTLLSLTAQSILNAIFKAQPQTREIFVCGGGALNPLLMQELRQAPVPVASTATLGIDPMHVESMAFAWLAYCFVNKKAGNLPAVTRARGPRILGALYPAGLI